MPNKTETISKDSGMGGDAETEAPQSQRSSPQRTTSQDSNSSGKSKQSQATTGTCVVKLYSRHFRPDDLIA